MLEALIADVSIFPQASSDRIALYQIFARLFTSVAIRVPQEQPTNLWEQRAAANLNAISPLPRQAFLLVAVEGFSEEEAAEVLNVSSSEFADLLAEASAEISRQVATGHSDHRGPSRSSPWTSRKWREPRPPRGRTARTHCRGDRPVQQGQAAHDPRGHPACRRKLGDRRGQRDP